jgi:O-antigen/teichoic acid export membrane protein
VLTSEKHIDKKIKINIFLSFLLKLISVLLNFVLIPITLNYLGKDLYGVWIVLLSIVSWITIFDIGIGNGLRNKIVECVTNNDLSATKNYISTSYAIIFLICCLLIILLFTFVPFINWNLFFKTNEIYPAVFKKLMLIYLITLVVYFMLNLITPILNAFQLSGISSLGNIISNCLFILILIFFKFYFFHNLYNILILYCFCLLLGVLVLNISFYSVKKDSIPSIKKYKKEYTKQILKLSSAFFIIQISALFIFTIDNYLILSLLGSAYVSEYNIVYKLFSIITIGFSMIVTPYWSAFTSAYFRKDKKWITKSLKKLNLILIPLILLISILIIFYQPILDLWLNKNSNIKPNIFFVIFIGLFTIISIWNNIYSYFLNGINNTSLQTKTAILGAILNVVLSYFFVTKLQIGLNGIVLAMILSLTPFAILGPILTKRIIDKI